jgi:hypothetical protein
MIDKGVYKDYKFLVLRDCYLTFDLICEPEHLEEQLNNYYFLLQQHLSSCRKCIYKGQMCKICMDNRNLIWLFDVSLVGKCKECLKVGHK